MSSAPRARERRRSILWVVGIIAIVGVATVFALDRVRPGDPTEGEPTFIAVRGPLRISVNEAGTIQAKDQVVLKNEVEGRATILFLIEEGTMVEKGTLLVEIDASDLVLDRTDRVIEVQNADAAFVTAREELAVTESQAESDVAQAELDFRFASEDLTRYLDGEYPRSVKEAQAKITLALEELENASETLRWSERLFEEKYISQTELERDRLAENRARLDHELAVSALELLEEYTHRRRVDELGSAIDQAKMALDRVKRKAAADVVQAEADLTAKQAELERRRDRLEIIDEQIQKAKIYAPRDGMVVYATTGKSSWRGRDEPLQEGIEVRERQELIHLPLSNSMMAEVRVHESSLDKVRSGQPVTITIDALPGRFFHGVVSRISPLPDGQSAWLNPDLKIYPTEILLEGTTNDIRTGMTCRAEIIVEELTDVIYVPVQCVVRIEDRPTLYVRANGRFEPRTVQLGLDNNHMVHVMKGLDAGDAVLLAPPLESGSTRSRDRRPADEPAPAPGGDDGPAPLPDESTAAGALDDGPLDPTTTDRERPGRAGGRPGRGEWGDAPGGSNGQVGGGERGKGRRGGGSGHRSSEESGAPPTGQ